MGRGCYLDVPSKYPDLHVTLRQVERHAAFGRVAVLDVTEEAHRYVHDGDGDHAGVEHSGRAAEGRGSLHVVLQSQHLRNVRNKFYAYILAIGFLFF